MKALGAGLVATSLLALAPMAVLGPAIGWPASLDEPAATQLSAIAAAPQATAAGYGIYLLYSVLIAPLFVLLAARTMGGLVQPLAAAAVLFAGLSVLARSLGILRWLTVMPALAESHRSADAATRLQIERLFDALHAYAGGVGELLGVGLFMALALAAWCIGAWRLATVPRPLVLLGAVSAALLAGLLAPALGAAFEVPMAVAVSTLSLWMLLLGIWLLWRRA